MQRTDFLQCLYNVHVTISPALVAESYTSSKVAKDDTNVGNKVYPSILRPWVEFPALHDARFGLVLDALGDSKLFPSIVDVRSTLRGLSPTPRFDEQDVRPFIRVHVESPARKIVNAYFKAHQGSSTVALELRNNAYGLRHNTPSMSRDEDQPPGEQQLPEIPSSLAPDRWGVRVTDRKVSTAVLIGEYKAAHKARAQQVSHVLDNHAYLTDSLFVDCVNRLNTGRKPPATQDPLAIQVNPSSTLAQDQLAVALCQAYHYMVTSRLS